MAQTWFALLFAAVVAVAGCKSPSDGDQESASESSEGEAENDEGSEDRGATDGEATDPTGTDDDDGPSASDTGDSPFELDASDALGGLAEQLPADTFAVAVVDLDALSMAELDPFGVISSYIPKATIEAFDAELGELLTTRIGFDPTGATWGLAAVGSSEWFVVALGGEFGDFAGQTKTPIGKLQTISVADGKAMLVPVDGAVLLFDGRRTVERFSDARDTGVLAKTPRLDRLDALLGRVSPTLAAAAIDATDPLVASALAGPMSELLASAGGEADETKGIAEIEAVLEEMTAIANANEADCDAMKRALDGFVGDNRDRLTPYASALQTLGETERVEAAVSSFVEVAANCPAAMDSMLTIFESLDEPTTLDADAAKGIDGVAIGLGAGIAIDIAGSDEKLDALLGLVDTWKARLRTELDGALGQIDDMPLAEAAMLTVADHLFEPAFEALRPRREDGRLVLAVDFGGPSAMPLSIGLFGSGLATWALAARDAPMARAELATPPAVAVAAEPSPVEVDLTFADIEGTLGAYHAAERTDPSGIPVDQHVFPEGPKWTCTAGGGSTPVDPDATDWAAAPWSELGVRWDAPHTLRLCYRAVDERKSFAAVIEAPGKGTWCLAGTTAGTEAVFQPVRPISVREECTP